MQIRRAWGGGSPLYSRGTGACSDSLWGACACSVPGDLSEMPEPGKKPGSPRPGVGAECGAGRAGGICNWGGPRSKFLRGMRPLSPRTGGTVLLGLFFFFFLFLGLHSQHYGGSQARGQIGAAAASLNHSSWQRQILNPLSEAKDRTHILMDICQVRNQLSHNGNSILGLLRFLVSPFHPSDESKPESGVQRGRVRAESPKGSCSTLRTQGDPFSASIPSLQQN